MLRIFQQLRIRRVAWAMVSALLGPGCDLSSSNPQGPPPLPPPPASPAGIYAGTLSFSSAQLTHHIVGVVDEGWEGQFFDTVGGGVFSMQFSVFVTNLSGYFDGRLNGVGSPAAFPGGALEESGSVGGTVTSGTSLVGSYNAGADSGQFSLSDDPAAYGAGSSLAAIQGTYTGRLSVLAGQCAGTFGADSLQLTVNADGTLVGSHACTNTTSFTNDLTGELSIIDSSKNAYRLAASMNCGISQAVLCAGFQGLAYLVPATGIAPATLTLIAPGPNGTFLAAVASK